MRRRRLRSSQPTNRRGDANGREADEVRVASERRSGGEEASAAKQRADEPTRRRERSEKQTTCRNARLQKCFEETKRSHALRARRRGEEPSKQTNAESRAANADCSRIDASGEDASNTTDCVLWGRSTRG